MGRGRYEPRREGHGERNGYENGTLQTAAGVLRVQVPQIRGREEPYRSPVWSPMASPSDVLQQLLVERYVGGMAQREIADSWEKAVGQFVLSNSTVSALTDTYTEEYEALRTRALSAEPVAYLFIDAGDEALRRGSHTTGGLWVWASCEEGRKVLLHLSTTNRESFESCLEGLRGLVQRGLRPPVTSTTEGAVGLTKAVDTRWPKSLRLRCGFHKMQNLHQKVPPQAWPECKALVVDMRDAPPVEAATERREALVPRSQREFPAAWRGLRDEAEASLNHLSVPHRPQPYGRPSHLAERAFVEERRRTKVIPHLGTESRLVNLVFAVLLRVSDRWGQKGFSEFAQQQIRSLRRRLKLDEHEVSSLEPLSEPHPRRSAASAA